MSYSADLDVRVTDSSLRDGSHAIRHQFTAENVRNIVAALDEACVPVIEVTHGDGLGGSSFNYGFSLVPDQDPLEIDRLSRDHIARLTPFTLRSTTKLQLAAKPVVVDRRHPLIRAAAAACYKGFGATPVFVRSGGTNPAVAAFHYELGLPTALIAFGLPDDRIHAPNEKFYLPNFHKGIATSIWFLHEVAMDREL